MRFLKVAILILSAMTCYAQNQDYYLKSSFGFGAEIGIGDIELDALGNIYLTGAYLANADFDPGPGVINLPNNGISDVFIAKYNSDKQLEWIKGIGGDGHDVPTDVEVDMAGNVYVIGFFLGTSIDLNPDPLITREHVNGGSSDTFIACLDGNGTYNEFSAYGLGSSSGTDFMFEINVDHAPDVVFVYGRTSGNQNFIYALTNHGSSSLFSFTLESINQGKLIVKPNNSVAIVGYFNGTVDLDPSGNNFDVSSDGWDIVITEYSFFTGAFLSGTVIGGIGDQFLSSAILDAKENLIITGEYLSSGDFDPGPAQVGLSVFGASDIFVAKYDPSMKLLWAKGLGGSGSDEPNSVSINSFNEVYVSGRFQNTVDFDPGASSKNIISAGDYDAFALKLSESGDYLKSLGIGTSGLDECNRIAIYGDQILVLGEFGNANVDTDPSPTATAPLGGVQGLISYLEETQPSNFLSTNVLPTSARVSFTNASSLPDGYIALMKGNSPPTIDPQDGDTYVQNQMMSDGAYAVHIGAGNSFDLDLSPQSAVYFKIYSYIVINGEFNYFIESPLQGSLTTPSIEDSQPTNLLFTNVLPTSVHVSFTSASITPNGYIALMKSSSPPSVNLQNGQVYTPSQLLGDGSTVIHNGTGNSFDILSLTPQTTYYFKIYSYAIINSEIIYLQESPLQGNFITPATEDTQPTNLLFTNVLPTSAHVSFTNASSEPDGYIALMKTSSPPSVDPQDGQVYTLNQVMSDGAYVVHIGAGNSFDRNLSPQTTIYFKIYSYSIISGTFNFVTSSPLEGNFTTPSIEDSQPTNLLFTNVLPTSAHVSFTSASITPDGYIVLMKSSSLPSVNLQNGQVYTPSQLLSDGSTVIHNGTGNSFDVFSLTSQTTYYLKIYSYVVINGEIIYLQEAPLQGNFITPAIPIVDSQPTNLLFTNVLPTSAHVSFTNASIAPDGYIALLKTSSPPSVDPQDGQVYTPSQLLGDGVTVIHNGTGNSFDILSLTPQATYYLKVYSYKIINGEFDYITESPLQGGFVTPAIEDTQPTNLLFTNVFPTKVHVSFTNASSEPDGYIALIKTSSPPSVNLQNGQVYQLNQAMSDGSYVVHIGAGNSFDRINLSPQTTYYFKIYSYSIISGAFNFAASSPLEGNFTTLAFAPEPSVQGHSFQISNLSSNSMIVTFQQGNGAKRLVVASQGLPVSFEPQDGNTYASSASFGSGDNLGSNNFVVFNDVNTEFILTSLQPNTVYHFRLYEYNGSTGFENYLKGMSNGNPTSYTSASGVDTSPPTFTHTMPSITSASPVTISVQAADEQSGITEVRVLYNASNLANNALDRIEATMTNSSGNTYVATIGASFASAPSLFYSVRVRNGAGLEYVSETYEVSISYSNDGLAIPFDGGERQTDYRIVAVPVQLAKPTVKDVFEDDLGVYDKSKWRLFGFGNNQVSELNINSTIEPGKGYWLISKATDVDIDTGPGTAPGSIATPFEITLTNGWNLIGNPYPYNVSWEDILEFNNNPSGITNLRVYDGEFRNGTILEKFRGAFIFNPGGSIILKIPVLKNLVVNGRLKNDSPIPDGINGREGDWQVMVSLKSGELLNSLSGIGMSHTATDEFDNLDDINHPRLQEYLELIHDKSILGYPFTKDIVPHSENHVWNFSIASSSNPVVEVTWPTVMLPESKRLFLWDESEQYAIDMQSINSYQYNRLKGSGRFKIIFGNEQFISENTKVSRLIIHSLFPNPVENSMNILFSVPSAMDVQFDLVDIIGHETQLTKPTQCEQGVNQVFIPDVKDYAVKSGIYLLRIRSSNEIITQRIFIK